MKLNRRGALASIIGGIFGGPEAAKSIIEARGGEAIIKAGGAWKNNLKTKSYDNLDSGSPQKTTDHYNLGQIRNSQTRIKELDRVLSGDLPRSHKRALDDYSDLVRRKRLFEIDNMKSISPTAKLSMIDRQHKKYLHERLLKEAEEEREILAAYVNNLKTYFENFDEAMAKFEKMLKMGEPYHPTPTRPYYPEGVGANLAAESFTAESFTAESFQEFSDR